MNQAPRNSESLADILHSRGMRLSPEREAIHRVLSARPGRYLTASDISRALAEEGCVVKTATVYNTLSAFTGIGLAHKRRMPDSGNFAFAITRKERPAGLAIELALECELCGKVKIVRDTQLTNYLRRHRFTGFDTAAGSADIHIRCVCNRCRRLSESKSQKK